VAFQATVPIIANFLKGGRQLVWVVAGDTSEGTLAGAKASTLVHLLDMVAVSVFMAYFGWLDEDGQKLGQREPRPIIEQIVVGRRNAFLADQVALLADVLAQRGLKFARIDYRRLRLTVRDRLQNVAFTRSMAPLATDGMAPKHGWTVAVFGSGHVFHLVGMAEQALAIDRALEAFGSVFISR
jgi:hypothetical protein